MKDIKDIDLKICAKFCNNLTKDEEVMVKKANVLPNLLRQTDRPSYRSASHLKRNYSACRFELHPLEIVALFIPLS